MKHYCLGALVGCLSALNVMHFSCSVSAQQDQPRHQEQVVFGQLQLPPGEGARGVHAIIDIARDGATTREWLELDDEFRFRSTFTGTLKELEIATGPSPVVYRLKAGELAQKKKKNAVDIGTIDLRQRMQAHTIKILSDEAATLRIGMFTEKPATDFEGNLPSLGSRQFPEVPAGQEMTWLLPSELDTAYFLVEEPVDERRGREWRSGKQKLFGPFRSSELPAELEFQ